MKKIPLYYVRGGTSSGVIIQKKDLPKDKEEINQIVRKIFGVPNSEYEKSNVYQIEGIGKGISTSNKCFIIDVDINKKVVFSTLLQLENSSQNVSWDVNCGNMTTAIPLVLDDLGLLDKVTINGKFLIYNTNTQKEILCGLPKNNGNYNYCLIPGIVHLYPEIDIFFTNPEGSLTNGAFPTGSKTNVINGIEVSCVDAVVPMVIVNANSLNMTGNESKEVILQMPNLLEKIESLRIESGSLMKIKNKEGGFLTVDEIKKSITLPKVAIVSKGFNDCDIKIIYLTPKEIHNSIAVSGGSCLTYACSVTNTIASKIFYGNEVRIKHYLGVSTFGSMNRNGVTEIYTQRNAQIYMKGDYYIY